MRALWEVRISCRWYLGRVGKKLGSVIVVLQEIAGTAENCSEEAADRVLAMGLHRSFSQGAHLGDPRTTTVQVIEAFHHQSNTSCVERACYSFHIAFCKMLVG